LGLTSGTTVLSGLTISKVHLHPRVAMTLMRFSSPVNR